MSDCTRYRESPLELGTFSVVVSIRGEYGFEDETGDDYFERVVFDGGKEVGRTFARAPFDRLEFYAGTGVPPELEYWCVTKCCCYNCRFDLIVGPVDGEGGSPGINLVQIGNGGLSGSPILIPGRFLTSTEDEEAVEASADSVVFAKNPDNLELSDIATRCRNSNEARDGFTFLVGGHFTLPHFPDFLGDGELLYDYQDSDGNIEIGLPAYDLNEQEVPPLGLTPELTGQDTCFMSEMHAWRETRIYGEFESVPLENRSWIDITLRVELRPGGVNDDAAAAEEGSIEDAHNGTGGGLETGAIEPSGGLHNNGGLATGMPPLGPLGTNSSLELGSLEPSGSLQTGSLEPSTGLEASGGLETGGLDTSSL